MPRQTSVTSQDDQQSRQQRLNKQTNNKQTAIILVIRIRAPHNNVILTAYLLHFNSPKCLSSQRRFPLSKWPQCTTSPVILGQFSVEIIDSINVLAFGVEYNKMLLIEAFHMKRFVSVCGQTDEKADKQADNH